MSELIDELMKEESLWDIWRQSRFLSLGRKTFWFNTLVLVLVAIASSAYAYFWNADINGIVEVLKLVVGGAVTYAITMLGFLLAGFAVMAGVTKPELWLSMAATIKESSKLSYLKYNLFIYISVFIYHMVYLAVFMAAQVFLFPKTILTMIINYASSDPASAKVLIAKIAFVLLVTALGHLLVQLKYFVFNVYHSVMTSLAWEAKKGEDKIR